MTDNGKLCEMLELHVFSDQELFEELNNHAKTCEHCRKFLEQNKNLEDDLKKLNVSGVEQGKIADAVMAKIRADKKKKSFAFDLTHRFGTIAAMLIICAVALFVNKNPSDEPKVLKMEEDSIADENLSRSIVPNAEIHGVTAEDGNDSGVMFMAMPEESYNSDTVVTSDECASETESAWQDAEQAPGMMKLSSNKAVDESKKNGEYDEYRGEESVGEPVEESAETEDAVVELVEDMVDDCSENTVVEAPAEIITIESAPLADSPTKAGGGGGSSVANAEYKASDDTKFDDNYLVFDGLEFLEGDENLEINVSVANARLRELYGADFCVIDSYCLVHNGWGGNAFFFETVPSLTYSFIKSLEGSSRTITGK